MNSVLMPLRAFIDSDRRFIALCEKQRLYVLMPLRAFIDSDGKVVRTA